MRCVLDRLHAMRGPGESYSDVILRLAAKMKFVEVAIYASKALRARFVDANLPEAPTKKRPSAPTAELQPRTHPNLGDLSRHFCRVARACPFF